MQENRYAIFETILALSIINLKKFSSREGKNYFEVMIFLLIRGGANEILFAY